MAEEIIRVEKVTRRFGMTTALNDVSLSMPPGVVLGLVGENGAGKTTLIKHLLGLLRAKEGQVRVFGKDPVNNPEYVLARLGYLSEHREDLPGWIRIRELFRYTRAFYPKWDRRYAQELCEAFDLNPDQRIKTLSKGQKAQVGLINALAHRPELLLLDEPSSGLDPVVRHDLLAAVLRNVVAEGRSVFFSSHLLDEIELIADRVIIMHKGAVFVDSPLAEVKDLYCALELHFESPPETPLSLPGMIWSRNQGGRWSFLCRADAETLKHKALELGARTVKVERPTLNEIFVSLVKDSKGAA
ncbi:MAG: ABC transporter ATP-binding protein [Phycisphaerales bacterium]|nr:MAG: ABC transporter ATP-binding protein [Phycisphaerales bacterium]